MAFAAFLLATTLFICVERHSSFPLIKIKLFKTINFLAANAVASCIYFALTGWTLVFGIYLERVAKMSPQEAGLTLLPFGLTILLISSQIVRLSAHLGIKKLIALGSGIGVIAFGGMSLLPVYPPYWALVSLSMLFGGSFIIVNSCTMQAALEFVPLHQAGIASGKSMMIRWLWGAIGAVVIATTFTNAAWSSMQKLTLPYEALNTAQSLQFLHEILTSERPISDLPTLFQGDTLSLVQHLVDQAYHKALVVSLRALCLFSTLALIISCFCLKSSQKTDR
jgi:hypothetical protein